MGVLLCATMAHAREYPCHTSEHTWVAGTKSDMELFWELQKANDQAALTKLIENKRLMLIKPGTPIYVKGEEWRYDALPILYALIRFEGMTEYVWTSMALIECRAQKQDEATPEPTSPAKKK